MKSISVLLRFPGECVGDPVISQVVRATGICVNILHARISPSEEGRMLARLEGSEELMDEALRMLSSRGVETLLPGSGFIWMEESCVHCGACAGICPSGAYSIDPESCLVGFDLSVCIMCRLCVEACYYGAIQSPEDPTLIWGGGS